MVRQTETSECGLACLAMVAGYHGNRMELSQLRNRFPLSAQGTSLKQLIEVAGEIGFSARPLRAELEAISHLQRPCILHWDMNHFVVLKSVSRRQVTVHDPATGAQTLGLDALSRHFTGIALELTPAGSFRTTSTTSSLRLSDLWTRIVGLKRSLLQLVVLSTLLQLFAVAAPFFMQTVVDDVVLRADNALLATLALGFTLLLLIEIGTETLRSAITLQLSNRLHFQLAANLFSHLIKLPLPYFQRRHLGDVLSRFSSLASVQEILSSGLVTALVDGLMAVIMIAVMFFYDTQLTLIVIAFLTLYTGIRLSLFPTVRRLTQQSIDQHAQGESSLIESIRAIQTIKLFEREEERRALWQNRLADAMNTDIRIARLGIGFNAANAFLFGLENILVIYVAAGAVMANTISLGMLFAFMSYKQRFVGAFDSLINQILEIRMLGLHLQRISDIALTKPERTASTASKRPPTGRRQAVAITCDKLSFRYDPAAPWIFNGVDIDIPAGSSIAITGPSGVGKSTLLKCMMGLIPPTRGALRVDGLTINGEHSFRDRIGAVMQDDSLMSGSIAENIACFDSHIELERVAHCARIACIHDDILHLPMQYNTPVGDMGSSLSGGQVQRIMLARAAYRRPCVLFLDEATSHLDVKTERQINRHIAAMRITRVMVAHRPDTVALADTVIQLRPDGRITVSRNGA